MKGIGYLLIAFGFLQANAQTDYKGLGKVFRFSSHYSMFPDSLRNVSPRIYQGKTYTAAEHYNDSSVFMFVPAYFDKSKPFHFVYWFHGWNNNIDSALQYFKLVEQFSSANINAIFVFPEGPKNSPDDYGGKFEQTGTFDWLSLDVQNILLQNNVFKVKTASHDIVLAGHSGAYRAMSYILLNSRNKINGCFLFDALYGEEEKFTMFLQKNKKCKFINIYTETGGTMENSRDLMIDMASWNWPFFHGEEDLITDEQLSKNRLVFLHSKRRHNDVVYMFERFLKSLSK